MKSDTLTITVQVLPDGATLVEKGRRAWALRELIKAGAKGCTPIDNPGPRWSGYVHRLRECGLVIETVHESHKGDFPGHHARYILRSEVAVLSDNSRPDQGGLAA